MKLLFFLYEGLTDFELTLPTLIAKCYLGFEVITIAYDDKPIKSLSGLTYLPDQLVSSITNTSEYVGLVIPGGTGIVVKEELKNLIQNLNDKEKLLAAICAGPQYLAEAGILEDKPFTVSETADSLKANGYEDHFDWSNFKDVPVVREGHIITAKGEAFISFSAELLDYFGGISTPEDKTAFINSFRG
jgi:putative intracellular protease/amidase